MVWWFHKDGWNFIKFCKTTWTVISFCYTLQVQSCSMVSTTTIRLDPTLKRGVEMRAKKLGLSFSEISRLLFAAFSEGEVIIGVRQYPDAYASMMRKELAEMQQARRKGSVKLYSSTDELFRDLAP